MAAKGAGSFEADAGSKEGIEFWRIENLNPVRQPDSGLGSLYDGDCYIFLHTKKKNSSLEWDLYFWLGSNSSQDEYGAAALRTVELDDQLGGGPVQYRETQGYESSKFLALFPNRSIRIMAGGVDSAFNKVDRDAYEPRLMQCKGSRNVMCSQVKMEAKSLNEGDVFILDQGKKIFQWNGKEANKYEKFKGLEMVNKINADERGGKCDLVFLDSGKNDEECKEFWDAIGGTKAHVKSASEGGEDKSKKASEPALIKVSDAGGSLTSTEVATGKLDYTLLDDNDVFIVDVLTDVFVWVGSGASKEEKRNGMKFGMDYVKSKGYANHTNIQKFNAGSEPAVFKSKFKGWPVAGKAAKAADMAALYAQQAKKKDELDSSMGGEIVDIWRIAALDKTPLDKSLWGQFWEGDSFIVLYKYKIGSKDAHLIYFWQGRNSSTDEKATSALLAKQLDDDMGGDPVQVRVVMGKEPSHFLAMFKGKMVVHQGGVGSGFKNKASEDTFDTDGISLFHVRGTSEMNTRAVQVEEKASSLNSGDCFVLLTPDTMYLWEGKGSNITEKNTSKNVSKVMKGARAEKVVPEGSEPTEFWTAIGGPGDYPKESEIGEVEHEPRLFQMTCNVGYFKVDEIFDYDQSDLVADDVMMLDVVSEVFLWVGPKAMKQEVDAAMSSALEYVANAPDGRDPDTSIYSIKAGSEPPQFTQHFLGWDMSKTNLSADAYADAMKKVSSGDIGFKKYPEAGGDAIDLATLQGKAPENVDPANKEMYLLAEEFSKMFGTDKDSFAKLPKWKRDQAKKKHKLF